MRNRPLYLFIFLFGLSSPAFADLIDDEPTTEPSIQPIQPTQPKAKTNLPSDSQSVKPVKKIFEPTSSPTPKKSGATSGVLAPKGPKNGKQKSKKKDGTQPVHFESNGASALQEKGTLELLDNVVVTQGSMRMEADRAKIFYDEDKKDVDRVVAVGNVKMFKIDEDSGEKIQAFGDEVVFYNKKRTVTMAGNARLWRGADLVRGKKITYEMDSGWIRADRVIGEVHPNTDGPASEKAKSSDEKPESSQDSETGVISKGGKGQ
jgi:lipopolysaccharide export system protein LptA